MEENKGPNCSLIYNVAVMRIKISIHTNQVDPCLQTENLIPAYVRSVEFDMGKKDKEEFLLK